MVGVKGESLSATRIKYKSKFTSNNVYKSMLFLVQYHVTAKLKRMRAT
jgi:hypothetical protein